MNARIVHSKMWIRVPIMQCFVSSQQSVEFIFYDSLSSYTTHLSTFGREDSKEMTYAELRLKNDFSAAYISALWALLLLLTTPFRLHQDAEQALHKQYRDKH